MKPLTEPWQPAFPESSLWMAEYRVTLPVFGELSSRTYLLRTATTGTWVYSPGVGVADSLKSAIGKNKLHLIVPNSFHHLGLDEWRTTFPHAKVWASANAQARLKKNGQETEGLDGAKLPKKVMLLEVPETRTGEVWLLLREEDGWVWLVGDAFFNLEEAGHWSHTLLDNAPGCKVSRLFWWGGLSNRVAYRQRLETLLEKYPPVALLPCHGLPLTGKAVDHVMHHALSQRR